MRYKNNKIIVIINTIAIFLTMFLFSNVYKWVPTFLTAAIFPVNESLFEHLKLMFITEVIVSLITYLVLKLKSIKVNNYLFALLISVISVISLFFIIYLPFYSRFGENLFLTMALYLIVLILGEYLFYLIITKLEHNFKLELFASILLSIIFIVLVYFTFNPIKNDFFFDPISETYGY